MESSDSKPLLYAMDPTTTLYTFLLKTDQSVNTVRLFGSWDNFAMNYAMERDSRRERGQWRGCHTFNDIICDGDASTRTPRSGGLKMGHTYYYYYELDGSTETHDPAAPSTSTCPYLPGQRVNTLWVPVEKTNRKRSASVNSMRHCDFQTMNPADKFVTPRPPPDTPPVAPAAGPALTASVKRSHSPMPSTRYLLRHQRSVRSLSPAPSSSSSVSSSLSTWSPRRLFSRRASPSREVTLVDEQPQDDYFGELPVHHDDSDVVGKQTSGQQRPLAVPRLASSSSTSSLASMSRLRHAVLAPSSQRSSRSRDISPESLRRFLINDEPLDGGVPDGVTTDNTIAAATAVSPGQFTPAIVTAPSAAVTSVPTAPDNKGTDHGVSEGHDFDFIDDDEHNFATSAVSESAPMTVLSPPPSQSRNVTPVRLMHEVSEEQQESLDSSATTIVAHPLPAEPTRAPPAVPTTGSIVQHDATQPSLHLDLPFTLSPPSPMSLSPLSSLSSHMSFYSPESHGLSSLAHSDTTDDDECIAEPAALILGPPEHPFRCESSKSESQQLQRQHRHHLVAAALTGSTATLVPGNGLISASSGNGLDSLVDELGWMATAIRN